MKTKIASSYITQVEDARLNVDSDTAILKTYILSIFKSFKVIEIKLFFKQHYYLYSCLDPINCYILFHYQNSVFVVALYYSYNNCSNFY
jgi:hypothetical protein